MRFSARVLLILTALASLRATNGHGQAPPPAAPGLSDTEAGWGPLGIGPPPNLVPPQGVQPLEDQNGPLLKGDPLLDGPPYAPPGWFAGLELDPVGPHVQNHLTGSVPAAAGTDQIQLPAADLGWTVAPRFEAGYRFSQGFGELLASYRFVEATGSTTIAPFGPAGSGSLRSRLDLNVFGLDYASREYSLGPGWDMKWFVGVRLASLFFDSQAASDGLAQRTANYFIGAGPHVGLELSRALNDAGLALFGRVDGGILFGSVQQTFAETTTAADGIQTTGLTLLSHGQSADVLSVQAGLGWAPCEAPHLRFAAGYLFERWWGVGTLDASRAQVTVQGLFLRGEWRY